MGHYKVQVAVRYNLVHLWFFADNFKTFKNHYNKM